MSRGSVRQQPRGHAILFMRNSTDTLSRVCVKATKRYRTRIVYTRTRRIEPFTASMDGVMTPQQ
jgi:hypothetical protein